MLTGNRACIDRSSGPVAISYPDKARMETSREELSHNESSRVDEEDEQRNDDEDEAIYEEEKDCSDIKRHRRSTCKLRLNIPCPGRRENVMAIVEPLIGRLIPSSRMYRGESAGYRSCAPYAIDGRYYRMYIVHSQGETSSRQRDRCLACPRLEQRKVNSFPWTILLSQGELVIPADAPPWAILISPVSIDECQGSARTRNASNSSKGSRPVESRANRRYRSDRCETSIDEIVESPRFFCSRLSISEFQRARSTQRVYGTSILNNGRCFEGTWPRVLNHEDRQVVWSRSPGYRWYRWLALINRILTFRWENTNARLVRARTRLARLPCLRERWIEFQTVSLAWPRSWINKRIDWSVYRN